MPLTDAELRAATRLHTGQYGSPIHRLHATGEITEHTHPALTDRAHQLEAEGRDHEADPLHDAAEYALDAGCRPAIEGWVDRR